MILKKEDNSTTIGTFTFSGAFPFDSNDLLKAFIPNIKVVSDGSSNFSKLKLKMYSQNKSGNSDLLEAKIYNSIINGLNCSYVKNNENTSTNFIKNNSFDDDTEKEMTISENLSISALTKITCSYQIGQSKYSFYYNK